MSEVNRPYHCVCVEPSPVVISTFSMACLRCIRLLKHLTVTNVNDIILEFRKKAIHNILNYYIPRYPSRSILCLCPIFISLSLSSAVRVSYTITKTSNSISLKFLGHTKD